MPLALYSDQSNRPFSAGQLIEAGVPHDLITRMNGGGASQVTTVEVTGVTNSVAHVLEVTFNGQTISVLVLGDASATTAEVAAALEAALDAEPELGGLFVASVASSTITLTGRNVAQSFTVAVGSNGNMTATITNTTDASAPSSLPFGRGVVQRASFPSQCLLPSTANDSLKVVHATPTAENSINYTLTLSADLNGDGFREVYSATYPSDGSATAQEIVEALQAALDAQMPANSIAITEDNAKVIFTSEVPNLDFTVTGSETGSTAAWTIATGTELVPLRFLGVSVQTHSAEQDSSGIPAYKGGSPASICRSGVIAVELDAGITPTVGDQVWLRCSASGSEVLGAFRDAQDAADCINVSRFCAWEDSSAYTNGGVRLAKLRLLGNARL